LGSGDFLCFLFFILFANNNYTLTVQFSKKIFLHRNISARGGFLSGVGQFVTADMSRFSLSKTAQTKAFYALFWGGWGFTPWTARSAHRGGKGGKNSTIFGQINKPRL
jgi:hypothetical protein